jgi:hypothetical protein
MAGQRERAVWLGSCASLGSIAMPLQAVLQQGHADVFSPPDTLLPLPVSPARKRKNTMPDGGAADCCDTGLFSDQGVSSMVRKAARISRFVAAVEDRPI